MKFTVSYSRKVKAGKAYEMMEIFHSVESDTSIESPAVALSRVMKFVDNEIEGRRDYLLEKNVKRPKE